MGTGADRIHHAVMSSTAIVSEIISEHVQAYFGNYALQFFRQ